jgi:hypothetical protein
MAARFFFKIWCHGVHERCPDPAEVARQWWMTLGPSSVTLPLAAVITARFIQRLGAAG